jgi:hypothetical protein
LEEGTLRNIIAVGALAVAGLLASSAANAIQCTSSGSGVLRTWNLSPADDCGTGPGNPTTSAEIETALFGSTAGADFTKRGDISNTGNTSTLLNITLNPGSSWGGKNVSGTWTLDPNFWFTYGEAVIHIHVGGGPALPDDFAAFLITPKSLSGTWSFVQDPLTGDGGGLSNLTLWTRGAAICFPGTPGCRPGDVPEPGTLALFGLGLLGFAFGRRRVR